MLIVDAVNAFVKRNPLLNKPDAAFGACVYYAAQFNRAHTQFSGSVLHLLGYRTPHPRRHPDYRKYADPDPNFCHAMFLTNDGIVVDFTNKQLDHKGPAAAIYTLDEVKAEWLILSVAHRYIENFNFIETYLEQGTKEWQDRHCKHGMTAEACAAHTSEMTQEARKCFVKARRDTANGHITLTGTAKDNVHLIKYQDHIHRFTKRKAATS